jgi:hypothetical protein
MKRLVLVLLALYSCDNCDLKELQEIEEPVKKYKEVCDECYRRWYSKGVFINEIPWGFEGCKADGNIYRYEDRDGTSATNFYPSNPGSYYVIRCTTKKVEI